MSSFLDLIRAFNDASVEYVIVGGLATILHGHQRLTGDVDFVISLDPDNARRAVEAIGALGYLPRVPVNPRDFADADVRQSWVRDKGLMVMSFFDPKSPLLDVDLFVDYPVPETELWADSEVKDVGGLPVRVCSINHLIAMKLKAARAKDLEDVRVLRMIQADG
ncbi:MAG TPA: nucleotidyl transferase AbiEii/AbiGii toxin family protein [Tepidisphaeraceae bacterium]|nr:nucleotidyl transferase AbiEii/AbiGii toxin family protein [Tepidisphaeraceae bacterium]